MNQTNQRYHWRQLIETSLRRSRMRWTVGSAN